MLMQTNHYSNMLVGLTFELLHASEFDHEIWQSRGTSCLNVQ
jgi:hypothetical protein